jgi:hypothetical protein
MSLPFEALEAVIPISTKLCVLFAWIWCPFILKTKKKKNNRLPYIWWEFLALCIALNTPHPGFWLLFKEWLVPAITQSVKSFDTFVPLWKRSVKINWGKS